MPVVLFDKEHIALDVLPGTNLRKAALKSGVHLYKPFARAFHFNLDAGLVKFPCAADIVEVEGKGAGARTLQEEALIGGRYLIKRKVGANLRLACQVRVTGDVTIRTQPSLEIDAAETKRAVTLAAVVGGFFLLMGVVLALIALDLVQKI